MRAHQILHQYSKTEPSEALHKTVAFVVHDAKDHTPFTSLGRIDTDLSVQMTPGILESGERSKSKKRQREVVNIPIAGLASMIVVARMHPGSRYSRLTDNRWPVVKPNTHGRGAFWLWVQARAEKMVKSRHSSTHFLQISWNTILLKLAAFVPMSYRGAVMTWAGGIQPPIDGMGDVTPARPNEPFAVCTISNLFGMDPGHPTLSENRNLAAHGILEPVLQGAIDRGFDRAMEQAAKKGLVSRMPSMAASGVMVNV